MRVLILVVLFLLAGCGSADLPASIPPAAAAGTPIPATAPTREFSFSVSGVGVHYNFTIVVDGVRHHIESVTPFSRAYSGHSMAFCLNRVGGNNFPTPIFQRYEDGVLYQQANFDRDGWSASTQYGQYYNGLCSL